MTAGQLKNSKLRVSDELESNALMCIYIILRRKLAKRYCGTVRGDRFRLAG